MFKLTIEPKRTQPDAKPGDTLLKTVTAINGAERTAYHRPDESQTITLHVIDKK